MTTGTALTRCDVLGGRAVARAHSATRRRSYTHDVVETGPAVSVSDRAELTVEIGTRHNLTDVEIGAGGIR